MKRSGSPRLRAVQEGMLRAVFEARAKGPAFSGVPEDALALYRELTQAPLRQALEATFVKTRVACERAALDWDVNCEAFLAQLRPSDCRLAWAIEGFSGFLLARVPPWIGELADYEWARFVAVTAPEGGSPVTGTLQLRRYRYAVADWYRRRMKGEPRRAMSCLAIYRQVDSDRVRALELQLPAYELLKAWTAGGSPLSSARAIAAQLRRQLDDGAEVAKIQAALSPLLEMLTREGILSRPFPT